MTIVVEAGFGLTAADAPGVANFAVAIDGARITATGSIAELRRRYPGAERTGGKDVVLLPAMCDSHDHGRGLGTSALGIRDDALELWLLGLAAQPALDPYLLAAFDGLRLVRSGVSTVLHSHNGRDPHQLEPEIEATLHGYRDVGVRVAFDLPIADQNLLAYDEPMFLATLDQSAQPVPRRMLSPSTYFDVCRGLVPRQDDLFSLCIGPSGPQWASDDLIRRCVAFARDYGLRMHVHALETWYQREYAYRVWGTNLLAHLDGLALLGPWLTLAHAIWLEPEDFALLAARGVGVAHNPSSNLRLRSGIAPVPRLLAEGVPVGVGLDGHCLDDDQDYLRELRLAWTLANRPGVSSPSIDAAQALSMGTRGGAAITLGPEVRLGRIEPGYLADLMLVEHGEGLDDWSIGLAGSRDSSVAGQQILELLLRGASRRHVRDVMINGSWVVRQFRSTRLDERAIAEQLRENLAQKRSVAAAPVSLAESRAYYRSWGGPAGFGPS